MILPPLTFAVTVTFDLGFQVRETWERNRERGMRERREKDGRRGYFSSIQPSITCIVFSVFGLYVFFLSLEFFVNNTCNDASVY